MSHSSAPSFWAGALVKAAVLTVAASAIGLIDSQLPTRRKIEKLTGDAPPPIAETLAGGNAPKGDPAPVTPEPVKPTPTPDRVDKTPPSETPSKVVPAPPKATPEPTPHPTKAAAVDPSFITVDQAQQLWVRMTQSGDAAFVDARNAPEYQEGRVAGAVSIPPSAFFGGVIPAEVNNLSRDFIIVVYCGGGECDASHLVQKRLNEQGFTKVYIMNDGYPAWKKAGHPTQP